MKKLIIIMLFGIIVNGCKEAIVEPKVEIIQNQFPIEIGKTYKYNYSETDTNGTVVENGIRVTTFTGSTTKLNTLYFVQNDSFYLSTLTTTETFVRTTNAGVYYFVDTTGFSSQIPDTILRSITIDPELIYLSKPLVEPRNWGVYKVLFNIQGVAIPLIEFTANFIGKENLNINVNNEDKTYDCFKVKYNLRIAIPDLSNNSLIISEYSSFSWFAEDVGLIKSEGSPVLVRGFDLGSLDFSFAENNAVQVLTNF